MALLTAEDVLNKAFSKTKYREGFDQDEVDDFLDEVANTIVALTAERDELAARIAAGGAYPEAAPVTEAGGVPGTTGLLAAATDPNPPNPAGMLAMAQKLHDEYVQAGEAERDRLVDEAKVKAEQIVERAESDAKGRIDELAGERADLESKIDDLRRFERDYRVRLKAYLENLLGDLDHGQGHDRAPAMAGFGEPMSSPEDEPTDGGEVWSAPDENVGDDEPGTEQAADEASESEHDASESEDGAEQPVEVSYDPSQPWEEQLDQEAEPESAAAVFAPVNADEGSETAPMSEEDTPEVAPAESEEAPYTPPSARMFTDLYRQPHKDESD